MLRTIAFVLVVIVGTNSGRVLACELGCANAARTPHGGPCHRTDHSDSTLNGTPHDVCADDVALPGLTLQKASLGNQPLAVIEAISARASVWMIAPDGAAFEISRAADVSHTQRTAVLRI